MAKAKLTPIPAETSSMSMTPSLHMEPRLGFINRHPFIAAQLLTLLFVVIFLAITFLAVALFAYHRLTTFTTAAGTTPRQLYQTLTTGWNQTPIHTNHHKNVLLLGVDTLQTRGDVPPLTDTMMLVSVNLETGQIRSLPLPRDIYSEDFQTKINALYAYGRDRYPTEPERFSKEVIEQLTGVPIHHTVLISMDQVAQVIDMLGGIEVSVETAFIDPLFPRSDVDVTTERDPAKLYETVEFKAGPQTMNGATALKYIRSRHSMGDEGDDNARARRQQQVIKAILAKATDPNLIKQPKKLGQLYQFYQTQFGRAVSIEEGLATAKSLWPHKDAITYTGNSLSVYPDDPQGVLINPPLTARYQNQWIYQVRDSEQFKLEVAQKLGLNVHN
ncbi:MAG TPA: LCP family protein [Vitreimonas sp.]|nr:LCP family protein [Vitreimonas sp.]